MRRLILKSFLSPGDVVMLTAAVRDLHLANPGQFETDVRTSAKSLWENNPFLTPLDEASPGVEQIDMHYPLIHQSNERPFHFIHGYAQYLEEQLRVCVPVSKFRGDIHLSNDERSSPLRDGNMLPEYYWIIVAGGKYDFTAKWWNPVSYQKVVDYFRGRIQFVQCGEAGHWHSPLKGVINLVGKTDTRRFVRVMYHAAGVVCPVTFAMHLAAAVETRPGRYRHRPCVVIAGGREPTQWEAYPHHQYLSTTGMLSCCQDGGCWKSRCQAVGDGDPKDRDQLCERPVQLTPDLRIPKCLDMITAEDVIRRIELYLQNDPDLSWDKPLACPSPGDTDTDGTSVPRRPAVPNATTRKQHAYSEPNIDAHEPAVPVPVLIEFRHGFGDAVQLTTVLRHLRKYRPNWIVDVNTLVGKHSAFRGLCNRIYVEGRDAPPNWQYEQRFDLAWHECHTSYGDSPSTKVERCLREAFGIAPDRAIASYSALNPVIIRSRTSVERDARYLFPRTLSLTEVSRDKMDTANRRNMADV